MVNKVRRQWWTTTNGVRQQDGPYPSVCLSDPSCHAPLCRSHHSLTCCQEAWCCRLGVTVWGCRATHSRAAPPQAHTRAMTTISLRCCEGQVTISVEWPMRQHYLIHHSLLHHMNNISHTEYNAHPDAPFGDTLDAAFNTTELSEQWEKMDHARSCLPPSHPPLSNTETITKRLFTMFLLISTLWTACHTLQPLEAQCNTSISDRFIHTRQTLPWKNY